jgi:hypothetical protein
LTSGESEIAAQYLGISAMLVETFSPNAVWLFGLLICFAVEDQGAAFLFFDDSVLQIEVSTWLFSFFTIDI